MKSFNKFLEHNWQLKGLLTKNSLSNLENIYQISISRLQQTYNVFSLVYENEYLAEFYFNNGHPNLFLMRIRISPFLKVDFHKKTFMGQPLFKHPVYTNCYTNKSSTAPSLLVYISRKVKVRRCEFPTRIASNEYAVSARTCWSKEDIISPFAWRAGFNVNLKFTHKRVRKINEEIIQLPQGHVRRGPLFLSHAKVLSLSLCYFQTHIATLLSVRLAS